MLATKRFAAVAVFGLTAIAAAPAFAADAIEAPPAPPVAEIEQIEVSNWAGPYLGLQAGYGFGTVEVPGPNIDSDGFTGGAFAGVQGQSGSFVYGIEGDVNYNHSEGSNAVVSSRSNVDGSLRARLGYAVNDRILIYATGGGAAESRRIRDAAGGDRETMLGWTVGAGVDAKLTDQVFGRLEYRYADYGRETFDTGSGPQSVSSQQQKVMLGIGLKF